MRTFIALFGTLFVGLSFAQAEPFAECIKDKMRNGFQKSPCDYTSVEAQAKRQCASIVVTIFKDMVTSGADSAKYKEVRETYGRISSQAITEAERVQEKNCPSDGAVAQFPTTIKTSSLSQ